MTTKLLKSMIVFLLLSLIAYTQESSKKDYPLQEDVQTIDGIVRAYYDVISGQAGQPRDWKRDTSLHHPDALITITGKDENHNPYIRTQSLSEYHESFGVPKSGFWEYEINRETQTFGNITHVWSTYETKKEKNGPVTQRGINSIQLYYDGNRWWILSWMFDSERTDNPIPKKYK
jgi:hypothetical protein